LYTLNSISNCVVVRNRSKPLSRVPGHTSKLWTYCTN